MLVDRLFRQNRQLVEFDSLSRTALGRGSKSTRPSDKGVLAIGHLLEVSRNRSPADVLELRYPLEEQDRIYPVGWGE